MCWQAQLSEPLMCTYEMGCWSTHRPVLAYTLSSLVKAVCRPTSHELQNQACSRVFRPPPTPHPASIPNPTAGRWQKPAGLPLKVKMSVTQSCPTLCDPIDCSVLGILQARIMDRVAISFSSILYINRATIWSSNPTPGHISREHHNSKRYMHPSVHCSTVYNSQNMERI